MQDGIFVIDAVTHCYDMTSANFAEPRYAEPINELQKGLYASQPPGYDLDPEATAVDYPIEDTANILFRESHTDVAIYHPLPIYFYKDGLSGFEKGVEAVKKWPNRFIGSYMAVDPTSPSAVDDVQRQYEVLSKVTRVLGLKLYPVGFHSGTSTPWRMDDPKIGFPLYEKVRELGLSSIAIHKSMPLGPAPGGDAFHPRDIEGAADAFPDLTFEIVHGGMAFTEETAWLFSRMPNIWLNLETFNIILTMRPESFGELLASLLGIAGEAGLERMFYGSGANNCHARPGLEAFARFQFTEDQLRRHGLFGPIPQLTTEHKRAILGGNVARRHGFDIDALQAAIADDEFSQATAQGLAEPYSTTTLAGKTKTRFTGDAVPVAG